MARSLFDPAKASGAAKENTAESVNQQFSVAQAVNLIKTALETTLPSPMRVIGEVSNFKGSNHWYFSLKDADAVLHCVAWATAARKFGFVPKDGDQVVATGHISHFVPHGRTQLYVSAMQPVGGAHWTWRFAPCAMNCAGLDILKMNARSRFQFFRGESQSSPRRPALPCRM
jgi:hypothetical protein